MPRFLTWVIFKKIFIYLLIWLCRVLVAAHGLFVVARGLLSSCDVWAFLSLVVACRLQGAWTL